MRRGGHYQILFFFSCLHTTRHLLVVLIEGNKIGAARSVAAPAGPDLNCSATCFIFAAQKLAVKVSQLIVGATKIVA